MMMMMRRMGGEEEDDLFCVMKFKYLLTVVGLFCDEDHHSLVLIYRRSIHQL